MDLFPLSIFPSNSLANSIIPVVWVGMFVVCFFNLRLGWVLSGLVVPGYVVPLMLIKPWSAGVIIIESILTYFLIWFFSEFLSRKAPWSNFFGRDRFLALVLCSIFIRIIFDVWLLPEFGEWLNQTLEINFDYRNHLHSFGLVIISLIANQFWKTGLVRGLSSLIVILTVTLVIVRYGLMEFTNFGLSNISYLYEDLASSILATPKAYIILITTAFLASRMNLLYGWDFNGILIPSLMALQWYQPIKILATMVEAGAILLLATALLKMPMLQKMTIEGARKLILFFNVSFAYKIALGYVISAWFPEIKVTDYFGFGYLLSTLMAVKIHDKAIFVKLTRATLQTSLTSVIYASFIGYALMQLPITDYFVKPAIENKNQISVDPFQSQPLSVLLKQEEVKFYQNKLKQRFTQPLASELAIFSTAIRLINKSLSNFNQAKLGQAAELLKQVNYNINIVQNRYLYLNENQPQSGWGVYVFDLQSESTLAISIPAPIDEPGILDAGLTLFETFKARSLAISGSSNKNKVNANSDVLLNRYSFFHQFHSLVNRHDSLQIRGYDANLARKISGNRRSPSDFEISGLSSILWTKQSLPANLNLVKLKQMVEDFRIEWSELSVENQQRKSSSHGFAELILSKNDIRQIQFQYIVNNKKIDYVEQNLRIDGYLQEWILNSKSQIAPKGSELYHPPKQQELLFLDQQVISPLLELITNFSTTAGWSTNHHNELQLIAAAADVMGYQIIHYKNKGTDQQYLILTEQNSEQLRYWGTYVFRLGDADNYLVQIPRPLYEINSFEYGVALFERIKGKILMIGTTHPFANLDGSSNLVNSSNVINLFNLVNQVALREYQADDMLIVNSRAFSYRNDQPPTNADILIAVDQGTIDDQQITGLVEQLLNVFHADGMKVQLVDGSEETSGYEAGGAAQTQYLKATDNKQLVMLWLSPLIRSGFRQQDKNIWQTVQFNALGVNTLEQSLVEYILQTEFTINTDRLKHIRALLFDYFNNADVLRLQQIVLQANEDNYQLKRLVDSASKQAYLILHNPTGKIVAVANLLPINNAMTVIDDRKKITAKVVNNFIDQRLAWLELGNN